MSQILRLEFICSNVEKKQAGTLLLRKQLGGGSKWRTLVVLALILVGVILLLYFQVREQVPAAHRPYVFAVVFAIFIFVFLRNRSKRPNAIATAVEVTEKEVTILEGDAKITSPWSAFSECLESPNLFLLVDRPKQFSLGELAKLVSRFGQPPANSKRTIFHRRSGCASIHVCGSD